MPSGQHLIRQCGLKATPQRLAVYAVLQERHDHPYVEQVFAAVRERHPTISLNTVYRTLESLEAAGVVRRLHMDAAAVRYDATVAPHAHLVCDTCGAVADSPTPEDDTWLAMASDTVATRGFRVRRHDLVLYGECPACLRL